MLPLRQDLNRLRHGAQNASTQDGAGNQSPGGELSSLNAMHADHDRQHIGQVPQRSRADAHDAGDLAVLQVVVSHRAGDTSPVIGKAPACTQGLDHLGALNGFHQ